ncbi:MAG: dephospho-CoA kinase [Bacteriovoracaceae bacterium]|nr:dephospho-CoA kinase [Bacteriovoracaceae bacterium]
MKNKRLYNFPIPIVGLTGGVATGKSTVSDILRELGYIVICADQLVKKIYSRPDTIAFIEELVPVAVNNFKIDFHILREQFFSKKLIQESIESYIYNRMSEEFLSSAHDAYDRPFVVYDAPVLFEKGLNDLVDTTVCVYAPRDIQLKRLLHRDNNSEELANRILDGQMDIEEKRMGSDFVIQNTGTLEELKQRSEYIFKTIQL